MVFVGRHPAWWVMLFFGCVECCAAAVIGCRLTAFEPFKRRIYSSCFKLNRTTQQLPLNPIRTLLAYMYFHQNCISSICQTIFSTAPKIQLLLCFFIVFCRTGHILSNRALYVSSCCYCSNQRPVAGLANQPGYCLLYTSDAADE